MTCGWIIASLCGCITHRWPFKRASIVRASGRLAGLTSQELAKMGANSSPQSLNLRVNGGCPKGVRFSSGARFQRRLPST